MWLDSVYYKVMQKMLFTNRHRLVHGKWHQRHEYGHFGIQSLHPEMNSVPS